MVCMTATQRGRPGLVPYKGDWRPVTLVGVNFRTAKHNIDEPLFAKF